MSDGDEADGFLASAISSNCTTQTLFCWKQLFSPQFVVICKGQLPTVGAQLNPRKNSRSERVTAPPPVAVPLSEVGGRTAASANLVEDGFASICDS